MRRSRFASSARRVRVGGQVAIGAEFRPFVPRLGDLVEEALPRRLPLIARKPDPPRIRRTSNRHMHHALPSVESNARNEQWRKNGPTRCSLLITHCSSSRTVATGRARFVGGAALVGSGSLVTSAGATSHQTPRAGQVAVRLRLAHDHAGPRLVPRLARAPSRSSSGVVTCQVRAPRLSAFWARSIVDVVAFEAVRASSRAAELVAEAAPGRALICSRRMHLVAVVLGDDDGDLQPLLQRGRRARSGSSGTCRRRSGR